MQLFRNRPLVGLAVLMVANLLLLSVQARSAEGHLLLRSWSLMAFTPVASGVHLMTKGLTDTVFRYAVLHQAQKENDRLRAENARLSVQLAQLRGIESLLTRQNEHGLLENQFLFDTFLAPVIWKSAPFYTHRLVINGGSLQGVDKDAAVISSEGIVGRVWTTTPFSSEVELITNDGAAAGAMLQESGLQGVVKGDGSELLKWDFIPNYEAVAVGDVVFTSGTDRLYPKGLPIGQVVKSDRGDTVYREIEVRPFVDYLRLEEIMVVMAK